MICWYCGCEMCGRVYVTCGKDQFAHPHCYEKAHPPEPAKTLHQALAQDPVLARRLLAEQVPLRIARKILEEFNERQHASWVVRSTPPCSPYVSFE